MENTTIEAKLIKIGKFVPYRRLLYLLSTGTQSIDTGYTPTDNTKVEIKYNITIAAGNLAIFGSRSGPYANSNTIFCNTTSNNNRIRFDYVNIPSGTTASDGYTYAKESNSANTIYTVVKDCHMNYINGILLGKDNSKYSVTCPSTACLFTVKLNNTPVSSLCSKVKLYYAKIWEKQLDGTYVLMRDFVPVLDGNDVPGLYDTVSKTIFYNSGSEQFLFEKVDNLPIYFKSNVINTNSQQTT